MQTLKQTIHEIADQLPEQATWDDVLYACYVRQKLDKGLRDLDEGRTYTQELLDSLILKHTANRLSAIAPRVSA